MKLSEPNQINRKTMTVMEDDWNALLDLAKQVARVDEDWATNKPAKRLRDEFDYLSTVAQRILDNIAGS